MMYSTLTRSLSLSLLVVCMAGCGGPKAKEGNFKVMPLTGTVKIDGQPLKDADVMFLRQGEALADYNGSAGRTDAEGKFEVQTGSRKGLPAGTFKVMVSKWVGPDGNEVKPDPKAGMDLEQMKANGTAKQAVANEFTIPDKTPITITVEEGKNPEPLNIEAKKGT